MLGIVVRLGIPKALRRHLDAFATLLSDHNLDDELVPAVGEILQASLDVLTNLRRPSNRREVVERRRKGRRKERRWRNEEEEK